MENTHDPKDSELIAQMRADALLQAKVHDVFLDSCRYRYSYNFKWLGRPVIQYPQDLLALQEIIWAVKPDLIVETGIAHGGSLIFSASMLEMIGNDGMVLGIDLEIRPHNRKAIEAHSMAKRIKMIEGSSVNPAVVDAVEHEVEGRKCILVVLDSCHTHGHVLDELKLYSRFVTKDSYLVVFDTVVEDMPKEFFPDRSWGPGNSPKTAVREFLKSNNRFQVDSELQDKLLFTVAPEGYLKCLKD